MQDRETKGKESGPSRAPARESQLRVSKDGKVIGIEQRQDFPNHWDPEALIDGSFSDVCAASKIGEAGVLTISDLVKHLKGGDDKIAQSFAIKQWDGLYTPVSISLADRKSDGSYVLNITELELDLQGLIATFHRGIFDHDPRASLQKFLMHLVHIFGVPHAYIGRQLSPQGTKVEVFGSVVDCKPVDFGPVYDVAGAPCLATYDSRDIVAYDGDLTSLFPDAEMAVQSKSEYFLGIPITDRRGDVLCHMSLLSPVKIRNADALIAVVDSFSKWIEVQCDRIFKEQKLISAHNDYRDLFDNVYDGILHLDAEGKLIRANQAMSKFIDLEDRTKLPLEYIHPDDQHIVLELRDEVRRKGFVEQKRFRVHSPTDELLHVEVSAVANYDDEGNYIGMREIIRDTTEHTLSQTAQEKSQRDLQIIFDRSLVGLARIEKRRFTQVNPHFAALLGYEEDALVGEKAADFIAEEDLDGMRKMVRQLEAGKAMVSTTAHFRHQNGFSIPTSCSLNRLSTKDGDYLGILATVHDLTGRVAAENALRKSQEEYRSLIETSPVGILRLDADLKIEFMSNQIREMHQLSLAQKELDFFKLVAEPSRSSLAKALDQLKTDQAEAIEFRALIDGNLRYFQGSAKAIFNPKSERTGLLLCYSDVTQLHQSRRALRKSQSRYQSIVESSPSGIAIFGDDYRVRYASPRTRKIFGYEAAIDSQPTIYDFIDESDRSSLDQFLEKVQESDSVEQSRFKAVDQQGGHFWLEAYASLRAGENGRNELVFILNDISELLEVERELEAEKAIYQSLIANSFEGIDILEFKRTDNRFAKANILIRNEVMGNILGMVGENQLSSLFPGRHEQELSEASQVDELWKLGVVSSSWLCKNESGEEVLIDGVLRILERDEGIFVVRIFRDVTQERASERIIEEQMINLNDKNEELERYIESNLQLENFAYIASHDLKAPARSIGSFADLLSRTVGEKLSERENHFLDIILESSRNMLALIDDLLEYSRLNSQKLAVRTIKPKALLESILQDVSKDIASIDAKVTFHNLPKAIEGDAIKLRQLFLNLISNSLKFKHPKDRPQVRVEWSSRGDFWKVDIKDNGIGIDEKYSDKVFLLFQKLHSSDKYDGSGMGLAISKKIVEQHFGKIAVIPSSKGAHITLTIAKDLEERVEAQKVLLDGQEELS